MNTEINQNEPTTPNLKLETLVGQLREAKVPMEVTPISGCEGINQALIFPRERNLDEKKELVRVFRGVKLEKSIFQQVPYAMRLEGQRGNGLLIVNDVKSEVDNLANNPSYETLVTYFNKIFPHLNDIEKQRFAKELEEIEEGVLNGYSVRNGLIWQQINHLGGYHADSGITPYISASWSPIEASHYGGEALLVIDIPPSQLEEDIEPSDTHTETRIKGCLNPRNITAIIPLNNLTSQDLKEREKSILKAVSTVSDIAKAPVYNSLETKEIISENIRVAQEKEKQQWQIDVVAVRKKKANSLIHLFDGINFDFNKASLLANENGVDVYTQSKQMIFDFYAERYNKIGRRPLDISREEYVSNSGKHSPFDRSKIDEEMLLKLKAKVERREKIERERTSL